jgi:hypothetical protein
MMKRGQRGLCTCRCTSGGGGSNRGGSGGGGTRNRNNTENGNSSRSYSKEGATSCRCSCSGSSTPTPPHLLPLTAAEVASLKELENRVAWFERKGVPIAGLVVELVRAGDGRGESTAARGS